MPPAKDSSLLPLISGSQKVTSFPEHQERVPEASFLGSKQELSYKGMHSTWEAPSLCLVHIDVTAKSSYFLEKTQD